jgi:hypothetical protein
MVTMKARLYRWNGEQVKEIAIHGHEDREFVALAMWHEYMGDPDWTLSPDVRDAGNGKGIKVNDFTMKVEL